MIKQAERPCFIDLRSGAFDDEDLATLQLNANDVVEWESGECVPELGASIFQVVFKGYPITDEGTLTTLGSVCYDACDYGLDIYRIIGDALYEARHPWLDWEDALSQVLFNDPKIRKMELLIKNSYGIISAGVGEAFVGKYATFKPIKPFDFHHFNQVKAYTP